MKPPIADPFAEAEDAGHPPKAGETFRVHFVKAFLIVTGWVWLLAFAALWLIFRNNAVGLAILVAVLALAYGVPASLYMRINQPVQVAPDELRGNSFWGAKRRLRLSDIQEAKFCFFFLPYVVISSKFPEQKIWLPMTLDDWSAFCRAVEKYSREDNPLRLFLFLHKRGY